MAPFCSCGVTYGGKRRPISARGCGFPPQGFRLLGWYDLCQSQQPVEKVSPISLQSVEKPNATP